MLNKLLNFLHLIVTNKLSLFVHNIAIEGFIRINDPDVDSIQQQVQEGLVYQLARGIQNNRTRRSHPTDGSNETFKSRK